MSYTETEDSWRVYRREWVTVHTTDTITADDGVTSFEAARQWAADNLKGRVRDADINVILNTDGHGRFWAHLVIFKDTLKGEFKNVGNAHGFAKFEGYEEYVVVPRNSKSDHDIRSYGVTLL